YAVSGVRIQAHKAAHVLEVAFRRRWLRAVGVVRSNDGGEIVPLADLLHACLAEKLLDVLAARSPTARQGGSDQNGAVRRGLLVRSGVGRREQRVAGSSAGPVLK